MKLALFQMQSSSDLSLNLSKMKNAVVKAKEQGAQIIIFPEMAYFTGNKDNVFQIVPKFDECVQLFKQWAKNFQVYLIPGTLREPCPGTHEKYFNSLMCINPEGKEIAKYRKIFLFQANLPHHWYDEGRYCEAGTEVVVCTIEGFTFGFAICFDLRFPEIFRSLRKKGARAFIIPSAFTVPTGEAHWETLLRARAIENQAYVIAPDQTLKSGENLEQFGHSLVVDPWGVVIIKTNRQECLEIFELDPKKCLEAESRVAAWDCRNEALFPIT